MFCVGLFVCCLLAVALVCDGCSCGEIWLIALCAYQPFYFLLFCLWFTVVAGWDCCFKFRLCWLLCCCFDVLFLYVLSCVACLFVIDLFAFYNLYCFVIRCLVCIALWLVVWFSFGVVRISLVCLWGCFIVVWCLCCVWFVLFVICFACYLVLFDYSSTWVFCV